MKTVKHRLIYLIGDLRVQAEPVCFTPFTSSIYIRGHTQEHICSCKRRLDRGPGCAANHVEESDIYSAAEMMAFSGFAALWHHPFGVHKVIGP